MSPFEVQFLYLIARLECVLDEVSMTDVDADSVELMRRELAQLRITVFLLTNEWHQGDDQAV